MSNSRQGGRALPESIDPFIKQRLAQAETLLALKESIISSQAETISLYREAIALIKGQPVKPVRPAYRAKILPFETWSCYEPNIAPR